MDPALLIGILTFLSILLSCQGQNSCRMQRLAAVRNGTQKIRGANLGSWFVMENFMSYPIWNNHSCGLESNNNSQSKNEQDGQYLFEQCLYRTQGAQAPLVLQQHWAGFINESTFADMSSKGINAVRLPVGWWNIYDTVPGGISNASLMYPMISSPRNYTFGSLRFIDNAFLWGMRYGIAILLGMHAAPGSQSGAANSSPAYPGQTEWATNPANVNQTIESMRLYAMRYGNHPALLGFYLLNEPKNLSRTVLQDYYMRAYSVVRSISNAYIIINPEIANQTGYPEDGREEYWVNFMTPDSGFTKVVFDDHFYSGFGGPGATSDPNAAIQFISETRANMISEYASLNMRSLKPLMIGEWSAFWNATNNSTEQQHAQFVMEQVRVYNSASFGWFYWSWLTNPQQDFWSLSYNFQLGWVPPLDSPACY